MAPERRHPDRGQDQGQAKAKARGNNGGNPDGGSGNGGGSGPDCGNDIIEGDEACDGANLAGEDCEDFGYSNPGGLGCNDCEFDTSGCTPVCDGNLEPGEPCDDGNDNPFDGCDECQLVDPPLGSCANPIAHNAPLGASSVNGNTTTGGAQSVTRCQGEETSRDLVYEVTPGANGYLTAYIVNDGANYDSVIYAMRSCEDPSSGIVCADNVVANGAEVLSMRVTQGEPVHIVVDGWGGAEGTFTLNFDLSVGTCADPVIYPLWSGYNAQAVGSTVGHTFEHGSVCGGSASRDAVYAVIPQFSGKVDVRLLAADTDYDAVLAARTECGNVLTQIQCDRDTNANNDEMISVDATDQSAFFAWVDGASFENGNYRMEFNPE